MTGLGTRAALAALLAAATASAGCGDREPAAPKSAATLAVEAEAGDFADYYAEVIRLSRRHAAHPDSFRAALDALPGTHLTDPQWDAWVAPYEHRPGELAARLEEAISTVAPTD